MRIAIEILLISLAVFDGVELLSLWRGRKETARLDAESEINLLNERPLPFPLTREDFRPAGWRGGNSHQRRIVRRNQQRLARRLQARAAKLGNA